jgi:hypothetical protein
VLRQINALDDPEARAPVRRRLRRAGVDRAHGAHRPVRVGAERCSTPGTRRPRASIATAGSRRSAIIPRSGERSAERAQSAAAQESSAREQSACRTRPPARSCRAGAGEPRLRSALRARVPHLGGRQERREILQALRARMGNDPETELRVAADEQKKIARLRLERMLGRDDLQRMFLILPRTAGLRRRRPLERLAEGRWDEVCRAARRTLTAASPRCCRQARRRPGHVQADVRCRALLRARGQETFYTTVAIEFVVRDGAQHYHVPLLVSPFGYSTYEEAEKLSRWCERARGAEGV